jgi:hypothetical protein
MEPLHYLALTKTPRSTSERAFWHELEAKHAWREDRRNARHARRSRMLSWMRAGRLPTP